MTMIIDGTNGGFFPSWTTATRPASPAVGQMGYNTTTGAFDAYTAAGWTSVTTNKTSGQILQVVSSSDNTERSTTSTSFVTASNTLSVTITPSSTSSKIYVIATTTGYKNTDSNATYTIYRNSTNLGNSFNGMAVIPNSNYFPVAVSVTDSPATTSATTYQVYFKMYGGSGNAYINAGLSSANNFGSIMAFEIAG